MDKKEIRKTIYQIRKNLSAIDQQTISSKICQRITQLKHYQCANRIGLYNAFQGEVDLQDLWYAALQQNKECFFPVIQPHKKLLFLPACGFTNFKKNRFGILEPQVDKSAAIPPAKLDLLLLPLVAFDEQGNRLGMGSGYYDRCLAGVNHPILIGVGYEFQRCNSILSEPWDVSLTGIITEQSIYWSKQP